MLESNTPSLRINLVIKKGWRHSGVGVSGLAGLQCLSQCWFGDRKQEPVPLTPVGSVAEKVEEENRGN